MHVLAKATNGNIYGWGSNTNGQLAGAPFAVNLPLALLNGPQWVDISLGEHQSYAVKSDGTLWATGLNDLGQMGDGTLVDRNAFTPVNAATNWSKVMPGAQHVLALKNDGSLWGWGYNDAGQVGNGVNGTGTSTIEHEVSPVLVSNSADWAAVNPGMYHNVAIKNNGTLWVWGASTSNSLGFGNSNPVTVPTQLGTDTDWQYCVGGFNHSLAIKTNGTLWGWGLNNLGYLGDGTTTTRTTPVQIGTDNNWAMISTTSRHTLALKTDGTLWAWGFNNNGQINNTNPANVLSPTQIGTASDWSAISAGTSISYALKTDGTLYAWGSNANYGGLGNGTWVNSPIPSPASCLNVLGVIANELPPKFSIYPNPADSEINITGLESAIDKISVTDMTGKIVLTEKGHLKTINIGHLVKGLYMIQITAGDDTEILKFQKK